MYELQVNYGRILRAPKLTRFYEDYFVVEVKDGQWAKFDIEDFNRLQLKSLRLNRGGYVSLTDSVLAHRFIMDAPRWTMVDHINRDRLDNRKSNLRFADSHLQGHNRSVRSKTGYRGVSVTPSGKYTAAIRTRKHTCGLGLYDSPEEAAEAYNAAAFAIYGDNATENPNVGRKIEQKYIDRVMGNRISVSQSGFVGVYPKGNRWRAELTVNGKRLRKYCETKGEAAKQYNKWLDEYNLEKPRNPV